MTTLIGWTGIDPRGPSSLYFAADSRFTWTPGVTWDYGRKLFASRSRPDILGYCGDVLFASHAIGQALEVLEAGLLYPDDAIPEDRLNALEAFLKSSLQTYPDSQRRGFSVIYASRLASGMQTSFFVGEIRWSPSTAWARVVYELPKASDVIIISGSGRDKFNTCYKRWKESDIGRTSRSVYSAFCEHVATGLDPGTGGSPQLVGIYRTGPAITFGVIFNGKRWLSGAPVTNDGQQHAVTWRDELFQRCDGSTLAPLPGAQRHARPRIA